MNQRLDSVMAILCDRDPDEHPMNARGAALIREEARAELRDEPFLLNGSHERPATQYLRRCV